MDTQRKDLPTNPLPRRGQRGFTLIEMLIVVLIIGMVAGLVGPALIQRLFQSQETVAKTQMGSISQALDMYRMDQSRYPDTLQALVQSNGPSWNGPYLRDAKEIPKDPWGQDFAYAITDGGKNYTLKTSSRENGEIVYK